MGRLGGASAALHNWAGLTAATCGSTLAGPRRCRHAFATRGGTGRAPPDVILAGPARDVAVVAGDPHRADRVHQVADPVGSGFVDSLARPGGNATGFEQFE